MIPGEVAEFPLPSGGEPEGITAGPDGNLWFTEGRANRIGRISTNGEIHDFAVPTPESSPFGITTGPDGNLWFTESASGKFGRITPDGQVTEFQSFGMPFRITAGPDGNVWFTQPGEFGVVGRITPQGEIKHFSLFSSPSGPLATIEPRGITAGPDGNLWVAELSEPGDSRLRRTGQIARITPSGEATVFHIPTPAYESSVGTDITAGPEGDLWFVGNDVGRITTSGQITQFFTPAYGELEAIAPGPDGNLWFSTSGPIRGEGAIGRVTPRGLMTLFHIDYGARGLTAGPDGNIWFTDWAKGTIGRITPGLAGVEIMARRAPLHRGAIRLKLACSGAKPGTPCRGVATLERFQSGRKGNKRSVVLGRAKYDLVSERIGHVRIRLTKKAHLLLRRDRTDVVEAVAHPSVGEGMRIRHFELLGRR